MLVLARFSVGVTRRLIPRLLVLLMTAAVALSGCGGDTKTPRGEDRARRSPKGRSAAERSGEAPGARDTTSGEQTGEAPAPEPPPPAPLTGPLARADELLRQNRFDAAAAAVGKVLRTPRDDAERGQAQQLQVRIEDCRRACEDLKGLLPQLAADDPQAVIDAQNRFFERGDVAVPLLADAIESGDESIAQAALKTLPTLRRPGPTLPVLVALLRRPEQESLWPEAIRQISTMCGSGAGGPLLELALRAGDEPQRCAALAALGQIDDPPKRTVAAVLPWVFQDGPATAPALRAFARAVKTHQLHDLATRRGWDVQLSAEAEQGLAGLPGRLEQLVRSPAAPVAAAARRVAVLTRQMPAEPLSGVTVLAFHAEEEDGRAGAVVDGEWNTTEKSKMWRYRTGKPGSMVLDLVEARTVCGVRVWNYNLPDKTHRGWKEVAVYVGSDPSSLGDPVARGWLPEAPGDGDAPDYSVTIPVDFRAGRYVRLRASSLWREDSESGLTEVEVLGF